MSAPVVALFAPSAVGHFVPLRPIITGLAERGADVHVFTARTFAAQVEACGGRFVDLFGPYPPEAADDESLPVVSRYVSFAGHYAEPIVRDVTALRPSLVIHDTFAVIGRVVAIALGIPHVAVAAGHNLSPGRYLPRLFAEREIRTSERCLRAVELLRERYGMTDASPFSYVTGLSPHLNLLCEPPEWLSDADRAPFEPAAFIGSVAPGTPRGPSGFCGDGDLRVHVSLGTVAWWYWPDLAIDALDAIARGLPAGSDVVMSLSGGGAPPERVAALRRTGVRVIAYADTWSALGEADLLVTGHGANATHEAIFSRVPMLGYPFHADQPELSDLCARLGVSVPLVAAPLTPLTPDTVTAAVAQVLERRDEFDAALERARQMELDVIAARRAVFDRLLALAQA